MKTTIKLLRVFLLLLVLQAGAINAGFAQTPDCSGLTATYQTTESRCTATGTLKINASGGSGNYNFKVQGSTASDFTSSNLITGLKPDTYSVIVKDIVSGCSFQIDNIVITGTYSDPRFGLTESDVTCMNGNDGSISVAGLSNGLAPFTFTIVAPSTMGIGTTNSTGTFTDLKPGSYSVQLMDSCGGIQTRNISIQNYNWSIASAPVTLINCTNYHTQINLIDSKGKTNASGTTFDGFIYGFVNGPADTSWFVTPAFNFDLSQQRTITLVVKDNCGLVQTKTWTNNLIPSAQATVLLNGDNCTGFNAAITGQQNLTAPTYFLTDNLGNAVTGQPSNTTGVFTGIPYGSYCIKIVNTCYDTVFTRCFTRGQAVPAITGAVALSNYTCTDFQAAVTGQQNLTNPQYCLFDQSGNPVSGVPCNTTGVFPNLSYGSYSIKVTDGCTATVLSLNFTAAKKTKSVNATITTNAYTCSTFTATVTGQTNLTSPQYCLVDNVGNPITCNSTGIFPNLNYGSYCINITDVCNDTTIQRCMTVTAPNPTGGSATISARNCNGFTVTITGQLNVFNGLYCLQDNLGNPVSGVPCNSTGVFVDVPYGSYCIKTTDGCSGTVLTTCFNVPVPVQSVGPAVISNLNCAGFTATVTGQQNLINPVYCLFDYLNNPVGACNSNGIFAITGFGDYSIVTTDGCSSAQFTTNFSVTRPIPSVGATVNFSDQICASFTASITGQTNLTNPHYFLKDNNGVAVTDNNTGIFYNIPYGSYCIDVVNDCLDTTITRCFTAAPAATVMSVNATPSCTFNATDIAINVSAGFAPYVATIYDDKDSLLATTTTSSNNISISGLPALLAGKQYKIIVSGTCGIPATQYVTGQQSTLSHIYTITPKCPSSITLNGSGDIFVAASTNLGTLNMSIIKRNGVDTAIGYSFRAGDNFTFSNLDAATYVVAYTFSGCSTVINDTIQMPNYAFPYLAPSGAYQCDNNSFSVGASVTGGMAPYSYQIIGSEPAAPSISSATQTNPIFTISNGVQYSLVRLRAIDACGNATLNDVSILPLANTIVTATSNCIYKATTLSVDNVSNATYIWYKKTNIESTDSTLIGTGTSYSIPAISVADTGIYVSRMSVNSGCLTKLSYFHLDGMCDGLFTLAGTVTLKGKVLNETSNQLSWNAPGNDNSFTYVVERMENGSYKSIGTVTRNQSTNTYNYIDYVSGEGTYYYRLKLVNADNGFVYTNVVVLKTSGDDLISVYPNPVTDVMNIRFQKNTGQHYSLKLFNAAGQQIFIMEQFIAENGSMVIRRDPNIKSGIYFLQVNDAKGSAGKVFKLKFD